MARNNEKCVIDSDLSIPVVTTPITSEVLDDGTMDEGIVSSGSSYDTSTTEEDEEDNYMISEMQSSSLNHNYVNDTQDSSTKDMKYQDQKIMRSLKSFYGYLGCYRPPFHVTAMYLWTQFNISYLLRKFSFLFDVYDSNYNDPYMDVDPNQHQYFHLVTIHYLEMGIMDIIIMNLIITLFLSTSYVYRSWQGALLSFQSTPPPPTTTTTTTTIQRFFQSRQQSYRSKSCLLEFVTLVTFLLLILRLRGAAINLILICTIFMFLHLISRLYQSTLPSLLLFPYKL